MADNFSINSGLKVGELIYPSTDGSSGQALVTDGNGNLSFDDVSGGGGGGSGSVERIRIDYSAGFDISNVTDETSGVSTTIPNAADSIISMNFTGHIYPPISITIYAYDVANDQYTIHSPSAFGTGTERFVSGGDANFGDFSNNGPMILQVDENNLSGLNPNGFNGPHSYILMWFLD